MNENDEQEKAEFREMLNMVHELKGKPLPAPRVVRMYWNALLHFSLDDIKQGLNRHTIDPDQGQFLPMPADIVRNIQGNSQTQSEAAWTKVDTAIKSVGPYQTVVFDDPIIHRIIDDMGGWLLLCRVADNEYPFKHVEFVKRYRGYVNRPMPPGSVAGRLIGLIDAQNRQDGRKDSVPVLIGDKHRAMQVLALGALSAPTVVHRLGDALANVMQQLEDKSKEAES